MIPAALRVPAVSPPALPPHERQPPYPISAPTPRRPRRFAYGAIAVIMIVGFLAVVLRDRLVTRPVSRTPEIRTVNVAPGTVERTIRLVGSTAALNSVYLRAPGLGGRRGPGGGDFRLVLQKLASAGNVRKGNVVAEFDRLNMRIRLDDVMASRVQSESALRVLRKNIEVARGARELLIRVTRGRMEKAALDLKTAPVRSAIQIERFRLAWDEARANYEALRAQTRYNDIADSADVRRAELTLQEESVEERRAAANLERMIARAPIDGLLVLLDTFRGTEFAPIEAGDEVRPGQPYAQVVDTRTTIIDARANQSDVMNLRVGAPVQVRFDAYPDLQALGTVRSISPLVKAAGWRRSYVSEVAVAVQFQLEDPRVIPGLTVSTDVVLATESSDAVIPREAVFHHESSDRPFAYVKSESGWDKQDLELGMMNHVTAAVVSGLRAGDVIAAETPPADYGASRRDR